MTPAFGRNRVTAVQAPPNQPPSLGGFHPSLANGAVQSQGDRAQNITHVQNPGPRAEQVPQTEIWGRKKGSLVLQLPANVQNRADNYQLSNQFLENSRDQQRDHIQILGQASHTQNQVSMQTSYQGDYPTLSSIVSRAESTAFNHPKTESNSMLADSPKVKRRKNDQF